MSFVAWRTWSPGMRVMVRHRIDDADFAVTDVIGEVVETTDAVLVLRNRHGVDVTVRGAEIVAGKPVPPAPVRRPRPAPEGDTEDDQA